MTDALTVVYQDLSTDEMRVIGNDNRVARMQHGCAITELRRLQAKNEALRSILEECIDALDAADQGAGINFYLYAKEAKEGLSKLENTQ